MNEFGVEETFLDAILKPHTCYYKAFKGLFETNCEGGLHGMAHITGGGIAGNLNRILPEGMDAVIEGASGRVLPLFKKIKALGNVAEGDMLKTFNCGVGMTVVCKAGVAAGIVEHLKGFGFGAYEIGRSVAGSGVVRYEGGVNW